MSDKKLGMLTKAGSITEHRELNLADMHAKYEGVTFQVWVTPTRAHKEAYQEILTWLEEERTRVKMDIDKIKDLILRGKADQEAAELMNYEFNKRVAHWMGNTWIDWTESEAVAAFEALWKDNPLAWEWLRDQTTKLIGEYRRAFVGN